jgi:acyl-CoA thioester hydrolase
MRPVSAFVTHVRVRFHECDPLGHVNNAVYLGYLEQAAIDHAATVGWPASRLQAEIGAVFVARRHEIAFLQPAFENDVLRIVTWAESMTGARAFRTYRIARVAHDPLALPASDLVPGEAIAEPDRASLVVRATTEWAFADIERGRPVRIPVALVADFLTEGE